MPKPRHLTISIIMFLTMAIALPSIAFARDQGLKDKKMGPGWHVAPERTDWPEHVKALRDRKISRKDAAQKQPGKIYQFEGKDYARTGAAALDAAEILKKDKPYAPRLKLNPARNDKRANERARQGDFKRELPSPPLPPNP